MKKRLVTVVLSFCLMVFGLVGFASPASAAPGNILPPFNIGETWNICQGYGGGPTHNGTSQYGLDLTGAGCDNSAAGRTVRAPIGGTVYYYQAAYGNLCVNVPGGKSYTLTHINSNITGGVVTAGQDVGSVAAPDQKGNNSVAHIHFQMWGTPNCYSSAGIPFDTSNGIRICGAPDLTATGPNGGNGVWSGTSFSGQSCSFSSTNRIAVVGGEGLAVKDGPLNSTWSVVGGGTQVKLSPNRIASLNANGELYVKEGALNAPWVMVSNGVDAFDVTDNRVGILSGGVLSIKEGALNVPWFPIGSGSAFSMSTNRIALYDQGNNLVVKEGALNAYWQGVAGAVDAFDVTNDRVGILAGGVLSIKQGALNAPWSAVGGGVSFELSSNRIASLNASGELYVKEGALNAPWNMVSNGVSAFNVTDNRVGMLAGDNLSVKEGSLNAPWSYVGNGVVNFDMS